MLDINQGQDFTQCGVCETDFGFTDVPYTAHGWLKWHGNNVLACHYCLEDFGAEERTFDPSAELLTCMKCGYVATVFHAIENFWNVRPSENVVFCRFCADVMSEGEDMMLPLSCTSKSQEKPTFDLKGEVLLKWLERGTMIAALLSIGTRSPLTILLSVCACLIMVFVRWFARGAKLPLPPQKKTDKKSRSSVINHVKHWLGRYTPPTPPF